MRHLITGGAGCIGSELAAALLARREPVRIIDNLSSGRREHVPKGAEFIHGDLTNWSDTYRALLDAEMVWHLAAKTDIKFADGYNFEADYKQNLEATWTLLRLMELQGVNRLAFASSAAVYGEGRLPIYGTVTFPESLVSDLREAQVFLPVLSEDMRLEPVSMYGATKLACEALIRAMALRGGIQSWIFRYCSIVSGKARTNGNMVIPDFIHKLRADPTSLEILGNGQQTKPSLHVSECVDAMQFICENVPMDQMVSVYNIGVDDAISVDEQAHLVCMDMGLDPQYSHTGGAGGWPGDVPSFRMDVSKLERLGWQAKMTSEQACRRAIKELLESGE